MQTDQSDLLRRALTQRNQAIACAILSLVLSLALVMNTFLGHRKELVEAHQQILMLQGDLTNVQNALRANQQELVQTQEALRHEQEALARAIQSH
jgi:predicted  nucleic acid-binding Zn-ribbon protein